MSKKFLIYIFLFLILASLAAFFVISKNSSTQPALPQGKTYEVILGENGFSPNETTIKVGDSIRFKSSLNQAFWPASDLHPTHGIYPEFDPQEPIEASNSWTFQFLKTGLWKYHDHLSPYNRGVITVTP